MGMDPVTAAIGFVVLLFSIIVHENAHALVAEYFGDPTARDLGRITLNPIPHIDPVGSILVPLMAMTGGFMFGWAKPVPVNGANLRNPLVHGAYVAAAGPVSNLLLALAAAILWIIVGLIYKHVPGLAMGSSSTFRFASELCNGLIMWNTILALFNLLPLPPLDGHWILMRFLPPGPRASLASVGRFGFLIIIGLMISGILWKILALPVTFVVSGYHAFINLAIRLL